MHLSEENVYFTMLLLIKPRITLIIGAQNNNCIAIFRRKPIFILSPKPAFWKPFIEGCTPDCKPILTWMLVTVNNLRPANALGFWESG